VCACVCVCVCVCVRARARVCVSACMSNISTLSAKIFHIKSDRSCSSILLLPDQSVQHRILQIWLTFFALVRADLSGPHTLQVKVKAIIF
jgi:hypothetical protein